MKFSIVTPTFNHKKYIETTIRSVIANKSDNYEIEYIVMDGGSTDGTQDVVNRYKEHVDVFVSEKDEGQSDAINKGFEHATGDIYAYINSDDYYYPDAFEKVAKIFEENPEIDFIYGNCAFVTEDEQFIRYFTEIEEYDEKRLRSNSDFIMQPASFWRKDVYKKCGSFNKDFHFGFDWEMWCRMAKAGAKFHYCKELLAVNRAFEETKTSTGGGIRIAELKKINDLHKTTFLPHAYFSYAAEEYRVYRGEDGNIFGKVFNKLKYLLFKLLAYDNVLYNMRRLSKSNLYGINQHSCILQDEARICFPYYNDCKNPSLVIFHVSIMPDQSGEVCINGEVTKKLFFKNNQSVSVLKLRNYNKNVIDVSFKFDKENIMILGRKNKILRRKTRCSTMMHLCNYYTSEEELPIAMDIDFRIKE